MKRKIILSAALFVITFAAQAQFVYDYLKAADNYFIKGDYYSASQYYEKYLGDNSKLRKPSYDPYTIQSLSKKEKAALSTRQQAVYHLAESYRKLNYHVKAEPVYQQAVAFDKAEFPLAGYHYATTLRALGKYEEAEKAFTDFLSSYTTDDEHRRNAQREVNNLRFIKEQLARTDLNKYTVTKAAADLNTTGASYAPAWYNNSFVFTSTRPDTASGKNKTYVNRIYTADNNNGTVSNINRLALTQEEDIHQGAAAFTPDGKTMFLTRWTVRGSSKQTALYSSKKNGDSWGEPIMLDQYINQPGYNAQQPAVTPDGKYLLFASDKTGGEGGFDIWAAELSSDGMPGSPVNLGKTINTSYDEQAPYLHGASGTLVFSSNGRTGMGGYDFFYSKGGINNWSEPVNFGYPVNSVKDDLYFVSKGGAKNILEGVYLSSDRSAECCLELFSLNKIRNPKQISGIILDCDNGKPVSGATVAIVDTVTNTTITTKTTGADGSYSFVIDDFQPLKAVAGKSGYETNALSFNAPADADAELMKNSDLCIDPVWPPDLGETVVLEDIYFDFDKATLREESFPMLDKVLTMLKDYPNVEIEVGAHTDNIGKDEYNQKLSEARAQAVVDYLTGKGVDVNRLKPAGYGETQPVAPNRNEDGSDNPEGRQKNRRTTFKVLNK